MLNTIFFCVCVCSLLTFISSCPPLSLNFCTRLKLLVEHVRWHNCTPGLCHLSLFLGSRMRFHCCCPLMGKLRDVLLKPQSNIDLEVIKHTAGIVS